MPSYTFNNQGVSTNGTNVNVASGATAQYLVNNNSASAIRLSFAINANITLTATRATGVQEILTTGSSYILDSDETVHFEGANGDAAAAQGWRVSRAETTHGLANRRGQGHTAARQEDDIAPELHVATI